MCPFPLTEKLQPPCEEEEEEKSGTPPTLYFCILKGAGKDTEIYITVSFPYMQISYLQFTYSICQGQIGYLSFIICAFVLIICYAETS